MLTVNIFILLNRVRCPMRNQPNTIRVHYQHSRFRPYRSCSYWSPQLVCWYTRPHLRQNIESGSFRHRGPRTGYVLKPDAATNFRYFPPVPRRVWRLIPIVSCLLYLLPGPSSVGFIVWIFSLPYSHLRSDCRFRCILSCTNTQMSQQY